MSETKVNSAGQKVTTYYAPEEKTNYYGDAKGDSRKPGESRVEQNRRLRDEDRAKVSSRSDSRENLAKEKTRKVKAEETIRRGAERVKDRQDTVEFAEIAVAKPAQKKSAAKDQSLPPAYRGMPAIMGAGGNFNGMPAWLQQPAAPAAASGGKRAKKNPAPKMMQMGTRLPDWYFSAPPGNQSRKKKGWGLPDWY
jgi:hypothetical protein